LSSVFSRVHPELRRNGKNKRAITGGKKKKLKTNKKNQL